MEGDERREEGRKTGIGEGRRGRSNIMKADQAVKRRANKKKDGIGREEKGKEEMKKKRRKGGEGTEQDKKENIDTTPQGK